MKSYVNMIAAVAVALTAAAPVLAGSQVVSGNGVSLTEAAQAKFNRDTRGDDQQRIVVPGVPSGDYRQLAASAGLSASEAEGKSLNQIFVAKINRDGAGDDQQLVKRSGVTMATRSPAAGASRAQLIASAGLTASEAAGLSLSQIAAAKFANDTATGDR